MIALEDGYGKRLLARKGRVSADVETMLSYSLQALAAGSSMLTENIADYDIMQQIVPSGRVLLYRTPR